MKRRSFIRGLVGAVALSMAPIAFNSTRIALAGDPVPIANGIMRLYRNGKLVYEGENAIQDRGVNKIASTELRHSYEFDAIEGLHDGRLYQKQLDHPIVVLDTETMQCVFTQDEGFPVVVNHL